MDDSLTQDYDAHVAFTFAAIPEGPPLVRAWARTRRWFSIAFAQTWLAVWLFRAKVRLRRAAVPVLPGVCDLLSRALFRVQIGNEVEIGPGLMITHGNVVIDGRTRIGRDCQINPWVTVGLSNSRKLGFSVDGPAIGDHVHIGTGAKVLGPVKVGDYVRIGANAVVVHDVPPNVTVVGVPARVVHARSGGGNGAAPGSTPAADERLIEEMRRAIVDFKLRRRSLRSLADTLLASFDAGSPLLQRIRDRVHDDVAYLDTVADAGIDDSPEVRASIDAVQAGLVAGALE